MRETLSKARPQDIPGKFNCARVNMWNEIGMAVFVCGREGSLYCLKWLDSIIMISSCDKAVLFRFYECYKRKKRMENI